MHHFLIESMISALTSTCNVSYYKNNADYVFSFLKKLKLTVIKPDGGFYVCFSIKEFNMDSITFCKYLAENYHLGLIPGKFFSLDDYVRISISCDYKKICQGMKKLNRAIKKLKRSDNIEEKLEYDLLNRIKEIKFDNGYSNSYEY